MAAHCPRDGTELVEIERSGVKIDACRTCRGVWLDRGELDKVLEREAQTLDRHDAEDEAFLREMSGASAGQAQPEHEQRTERGFDRGTAERIFEEFSSHKKRRYEGDGSYKKRRKKSFLDELFD